MTMTTPTLEQALRRAAQVYGERGLAAHPLVRDPDGYAKRPMFEDGAAWLKFTPPDNDLHPWDRAAGIGLILGAPPGNLGCVDVDDPGLADGLRRHFEGQTAPPLLQTTVRDGLHILVVEPEPSISVDLEVRWQGRWAPVQLLGRQRQIAVAPTGGYKWVDPHAAPLFGTLGAKWHALALELGLNYRLSRYTPKGNGRAWSRSLP